ncbi:MAG: nickel transporter [Candidatus Dormibacteraeota bacterium]|uniref:Nickel transporter n=1 Tax=Candidatus Amunia macphersoniae TaxID=3127014 RepID=A0A934KD52_9BACT|nr:nickel transporter [Candidatus Dormibacteraeota bacterium]
MRSIAGATLGLSALVLLPIVASAHPLGNFTVNQYSGLVVRSDGVDVNYVLDMAEIPTAQLLSQLDSDESRLLTTSAADNYRHSECSTLEAAIAVRIDGATARLTVASSSLAFPPGAAGLHTLRLTCRFSTTSTTSPAGHSLTYANRNFDDRVGWREITAVGSSARLASSDVPATSISAQLTSYPADLLSSPLDLRGASLAVVDGSGGGGPTGVAPGPASILPRGVDQFTTAFVGLISRQDVNALFVVLALGLALVLGGIHAFAPGHGKTLMAAYLVGQRGSLRHAAALAGSVTATHTIGVLALGVALSVSTSFAPTAIYPVLGVVSGLIVVSIGLTLLLRAYRTRTPRAITVLALEDGSGATALPHELAAHVGLPGAITDAGHHHAHEDEVDAQPAAHQHGGRHHTHLPATTEAPRLRSVLAIGFAGGMVPSPSALVVLIGGIALHRTWFAVLLVLAYGVGMAVVLTGTGVALRHARTVIDRRLASRSSMPGRVVLARIAAAVPLLTGAAVVVVGVGLTLRSGGAI